MVGRGQHGREGLPEHGGRRNSLRHPVQHAAEGVLGFLEGLFELRVEFVGPRLLLLLGGGVEVGGEGEGGD